MLSGLVDVPTLLELCLAGWVVYGLLTALYNIYFHPLRQFPGPLAARASNGWKLYMEVFRQESPAHLLQKLHQQYGDVVRIRPNELHFSSATAYHDIYNPSARWDKDRVQYESVGADHSMVSLIPYEAAKQRKAVLKSLFSRRAVLNLQGLVRRKVDHLVQVLQQRNEEGKSSDLLMAFRCMALDAATDFCFGTSLDALDVPDFRAPLLVAMDAALPGFAVMKHFPLLRKVALHLPPWLIGAIYPDLVGLPRTQQMLRQQVSNVITHPEILKAKPHPTVYHRLLDPEAQNTNVASREAVLFDEANTLMFEATHTVADPTMFGLFHILSNPVLYERLLDEIRTVWPDASAAPRLEVLETLPLLTATIKESLRMAPGIASPLFRVTPAEGAVIDGQAVPAGATVGMSIYHVHHNGALFANPEHFDPDRWLHGGGDDNEKGAASLDQWFVAFSRGPRSCPGSNLAWCEMYILLSTMLRTFDLRLDRTTANDLAWRDCLVPYFTGRHLHAWCLPSKE
ncbi:cytochrome p450 domain-containing protein [Apiospora saccharicola]|uniref:Cytochrome p450 domain-containing protein n=1 Tax=Apiospora saccharicola TaxID=335842 RepID=A0ABR1WJ69_9PEZI